MIKYTKEISKLGPLAKLYMYGAVAMIGMFTLVGIFTALNNNVRNSNAAADTVTYAFDPASAEHVFSTTGQNTYSTTLNLSATSDTNDKGISGSDITFATTGSANGIITKIGKPIFTGCDASVEIILNTRGDTPDMSKEPRIVFVVKQNTNGLPKNLQIPVTYKGNAVGSLPLSIKNVIIVGNTTYTPSLGTGMYTFTGTGSVSSSPSSQPQVCTTDVKACPDGSFVSRDPANSCNFRNCPIGGDASSSSKNTAISSSSKNTISSTPSSSGTTSSTTPAGKGVTLNLKVSLQGIVNTIGRDSTGGSGDRQNPLAYITTTTLPFTVTLAGNSNVYTKDNINFTIDKNTGVWSGSVVFDQAVAGAGYRVYVKGPKHLRRELCSTNGADSNNKQNPDIYRCKVGESLNLSLGNNDLDFSKVIIFAGDLKVNGTQDGIINAADIAYMYNLPLFGNSATPTDVQAIADLNLDGRVDANDIALLISSMGVRYDDSVKSY